MSKTEKLQLELPFNNLFLGRVSQKILIELTSLLKNLPMVEIPDLIGVKSSSTIESAITELQDKNYVIIRNDELCLNVSKGEMQVLQFLNTGFMEHVKDDFEEFQISTFVSFFESYLNSTGIEKTTTTIYKQVDRAFKKFVDFHFLEKPRLLDDKYLLYKLNLDFFIHTSPSLKMAYHLIQSINEIKDNMGKDKIHDLHVHNLHVYYLDENDDQIYYHGLKNSIEQGIDKNWVINYSENGCPCIYNEENKNGDFDIRVFEGKKLGHSSITITICQDKIKHAIPLTRLPFLLGEINRFLNVEYGMFFKNIDIEDFSITMVHYNLDFELNNSSKHELFSREIGKEITLGTYTNHFLFRFYQLVDREYRFEAQITKQNSTEPTTVKDIVNETEPEMVFRTIRGMMKNGIELINEQIDIETNSKKILEISENNEKKLRNIKFQIRDFSSYLGNKLEILKHSNEINHSITQDDLNNLKNEIENYSSEQSLILENLNAFQDGYIEIQEKMVEFIGDNFQITNNFISDNYNAMSSQLKNMQVIHGFFTEYLLYCDKKTRDIIMLTLKKTDLQFPTSEVLRVIEDFIERLKIKKKRFGKITYQL